MADLTTIEGVLAAGEARFALVASRFNSFVVESLIAGAVDTLRRHGVANDRITLVRAPGAYWPFYTSPSPRDSSASRMPSSA